MAENEETVDTVEELNTSAPEAADSEVNDVDVDDVAEEATEEVEEELSSEELAGIRAAEALKKTLDHPETLSPRVQAAVKRTEEETRRVEKAVEGTKSNPSWFVPLFSFFLVLGLIWVIVYYITPNNGYPIPGIGYWNLAIGFAIMMVGFVLMMSWH
ncbi:cell division protein CrgA [Alloscardovia omnicolens]|uniref:Cell division protein CrgA n=1 Tax=Alloscardovia omnicolens TaxID=419015 RepID=A0A2I1M3X9_9BIFI|nr:cell division protein CrgA [Alloscardovia omnicolens]KWZ75803.1 putative septation inhibitor protein [Alloscardovia omnicolens]MDK6250066.1 cell division protein CrgA [Alloscardovia omnicolens]MDK6251323.1 cell division protein CrgA [Alloscardovia omnicolens]MDK6327522.1 cell division protein CrgA [Alloscardovia omnicolens]MDK6445140.1 cell division protein CrgA [Alloscardovia omnicolens]